MEFSNAIGRPKNGPEKARGRARRGPKYAGLGGFSAQSGPPQARGWRVGRSLNVHGAQDSPGLRVDPGTGQGVPTQRAAPPRLQGSRSPWRQKVSDSASGSGSEVQTGADYYDFNVKGQVPLPDLDDGTRLSEGPVISQFIADQAANTSLMPAAGSLARYRVMEWMNYVTSEIHKSFTPLFNAAFNASAKELHAHLLRKKFEWIDSQLSGSKYLTGEAFTAADAYLFTVTGWAKHVQMGIADLPHLQRFLVDVAARPAVREAMKAEGLLT